ncbi:hypothetical protein D9758_012965 [Tetrapyrgos nigripes]|uniref:Yeast cell wall synthesis Kre9/Knh1-like N-terminal domain-containing protein n=1 Tax=Tetrapyrgos nigripes TaxID=182062 RepID=A0A8H5FP55_9AGAR|nr:hypothetical protein D9758_012965 [Tetrapyrgos nigripes]
MLSKISVVSLLTSGAFAAVYINSPTESIGMTGGQTAKISWIDQGSGPSLADFGDAKIGIYTGNSKQQILLQTISDRINVAKSSSLQFTPDAGIGPNGNNYFVRFDSLTLKDSANPQSPAMAFSSRFTMSGMSGTFNASVQSLINGQSTAPIGGTSTATAPSMTSGIPTTSASSNHTATGSGARASSTARVNNSASSMGATVASFLVAVLAGVIAVSYVL